VMAEPPEEIRTALAALVAELDLPADPRQATVSQLKRLNERMRDEQEVQRDTGATLVAATDRLIDAMMFYASPLLPGGYEPLGECVTRRQRRARRRVPARRWKRLRLISKQP
jgi:hypothetical protein